MACYKLIRPSVGPDYGERATCHPDRVACHPERLACHPERATCHPERSEGSRWAARCFAAFSMTQPARLSSWSLVILSGSLVIPSGSLVILSGSLVILSAAKDLALGPPPVTIRGTLSPCQNATVRSSLVILSGSLVILSGSLVILSEAKDLALDNQTFRGVSPERSERAQADNRRQQHT